LLTNLGQFFGFHEAIAALVVTRKTGQAQIFYGVQSASTAGLEMV
jgi:hypothetical protein